MSYAILSANVAIGDAQVPTHSLRALPDGILKIGRDAPDLLDTIHIHGNVHANLTNTEDLIAAQGHANAFVANSIAASEVVSQFAIFGNAYHNTIEGDRLILKRANLDTLQGNSIYTGNMVATVANVSSIEVDALYANGEDFIQRIDNFMKSDTRLYVSATRGNDSYHGKNWEKPFRTIKAAVQAATSGTTIYIESGSYLEHNPIIVPSNVALIGDNLRRVLLYPQNPRCDFLHLNNMCYVTGLRFLDLQRPAYCCAFPCALAEPTLTDGSVSSVTLQYSPTGYTAPPAVLIEYPDDPEGTVAQMHAELDEEGRISSLVIDDPGSGYTEPPHISIPAPSSQRPFIAASPYVQNCSSVTGPFTTAGTKIPVSTPLPYDTTDVDPTGAGGGIRIDGNVCHPASPLRSFVADSFTQVNQGGPGFFVVFRGYAQFVSCFTTFASVSYKASSGGSTNISNSVTDFGLYGLVSKGYDRASFTQGSVATTARTTVATFQITDGGSGYTVPPDVTITGGGGVGATAVASLLNGQIDELILTNGGSGYTSPPTVTISGGDGIGGSAVAVLAGLPSIRLHQFTARRPDIGSVFYYGGQWRTVTGAAVVTPGVYDITAYPALYFTDAGDTVPFYIPSVISTGTHVFELAGSGVTYNALPEYGGIPLPANETLATAPGKVYFTSSDPLGNFRVGNFFAVEQSTGQVTIDATQFNLAGLNRIGPFRRNGVAVGVPIEEASNNPFLIASTGVPDPTTVPTQSAVKSYVDLRVPPGNGNASHVLSKVSGNAWDMEWRSLTKTDVGLGNVIDVVQLAASEKGVANGVATLDGSGILAPSQRFPVTKATVGLGNVIDVLQLAAAEKGTANGVATLDATGILSVSQRFPVTKATVGLGNVIDVVQLAASEKGVANGVATLDASGILAPSQRFVVTKSDVGLGNVIDVVQLAASEKGVANGVATLDATGHVPYNQLPESVTSNIGIPYSEKGAIDGVATLDNTGKVPLSQLPANIESGNAIPYSEKGVANGVATLDGSGILSVSQRFSVTKANIGLGNVIDVVQLAASEKGVANGVATLDSSGILSVSQRFPVTKTTIGLGNVIDVLQLAASEKGIANGVATLDATGRVPYGQLPESITSNIWIPYSEKGAPDGVATLDNTGKIPLSQLPANIETANAIPYSEKGVANGVATLNALGYLASTQFPNVLTVSEKIVVSGGTTQSTGGEYAYFKYAANVIDFGADASTTTQISVAAQHAVQASQFIALSDARVKANIQDASSNASHIVSTTLATPIKTWQYKDTVRHDARPRIGCIAQDLAQTPLGEYVISKHRDIVPNIMRRAVLYGNIYELDNHGLQPGSTVRYYTSTETKDAVVTETTASTFSVEPPESAPGIFVLGTYADDVMSVDYDALTAAMLMTMQDLHRRLETLEKSSS